MHKKNYPDFARIIRKQKNKIHNDLIQPDIALTITEQKVFSDGAMQSLESFVDELVTIFKNDNPKFDAEKFIKACEIDTEST